MCTFPENLGHECSAEYRRIIASQWWPTETLESQGFEKLKRTIKFAYNHIPYYRKSFDQAEIYPKAIQSPEDLTLLPILTKDDLRNHFDELSASKSYLDGARLERTSGSTGTPVKFYISKHVDEIEYAFLWRQWNWAGFNYGDRAMVVRGLKIMGSANNDPPYSVDRVNGRRNLYISSYHLSESNLHFYFNLIKRFRPNIIRAYPSTLDIITRFAQAVDYETPHIHSIITSSETLLDSVRQRAESFWRCKVYDWYGQRERVAAAGQCEYGIYHLCDDYSFIEFIEIESGLVEIVGSSFNNIAMPLLRYRTGDLVRKLDLVCPCGRGLRVMGPIEGRNAQTLLTMDRRWLFPFSLNDIFEPCSNLRMAKVIQREYGCIEVEIVPTERFCDYDRFQLDKSLKSLLGVDIQIRFRIVADIEPGTTGKRPIVVSYLPAPFS